MTEEDQTRNLNAHAEALLCSWIYGREYSQQMGGVMDFWDKQNDTTKAHMKESIDELLSRGRPDIEKEGDSRLNL